MKEKSLVIYFSHTGENYMEDGIRLISKGNTEIIAEMIQQLTHADLFQVETLEDYPFNYKKCTEVALEEKNKRCRPKLKKYLSSIEEYDIIYIGYPNWWGTMPMPVFSLLEQLDFNGKMVKPFCTHEGSGMGSSLSDLKKICKNARIKNGLAIRGSYVSSAKGKVEEWIKQ